MAAIVTGDLYHKLDGQLCELKRQLRQHEGYPYNPEDLQRALQEIIEGRVGPPAQDRRFGLLLMSEPIIVPLIEMMTCVKKYAAVIERITKWEYFQPSAPLRPGSERRLCVYVARRHLSEVDCIQFIKEQGGILSNLQGLFIALETELLPKNNTCIISSLDEKEHLALSHGGRRVVPNVVCHVGDPGVKRGNTLQWQFWGAGVDKGSCIMFFK